MKAGSGAMETEPTVGGVLAMVTLAVPRSPTSVPSLGSISTVHTSRRVVEAESMIGLVEGWVGLATGAPSTNQ